MLLLFLFILVFAAGFILPWWVLAIICFVITFWLAHSGSQAFWSGFAAVFAAWIILGLIKSVPNDNALANRIAHLFFLPNWIAILIVTGVVGGLVGGMAGLSGLLTKRMLAKDETPASH